jgi:ABC-type microcin C transport system permease subunit YejE
MEFKSAFPVLERVLRGNRGSVLAHGVIVVGEVGSVTGALHGRLVGSTDLLEVEVVEVYWVHEPVLLYIVHT